MHVRTYIHAYLASTPLHPVLPLSFLLIFPPSGWPRLWPRHFSSHELMHALTISAAGTAAVVTYSLLDRFDVGRCLWAA